MKIGIDTIGVSRIKNAAEKNAGFITRVFTKNEIKYFSKGSFKWESAAGFFAAKEAFSKYLGTGIRDMNFSDIEICHDELKKPYIRFRGKASSASLSISHSDGLAIAVVAGVGNGEIKHSEYIKSLLPKRRDDAHKGDFGRLFILAGSAGMTGAASLSALGALRSGVGLLTVGTEKEERKILAIKLTEAMTMGFEGSCGGVGFSQREKIKEAADAADAFVIGPGMGRASETARLIRYLTERVKTPMIIDADGLNALSGNIDILKRRKGETIITPHEGEMARLCAISAEEVHKNREKIAKDFAKESGAVVVLKGKNTIVAGDEIFVNPTGNSGMATGGSGDVLSGVIGSFAAQGLPLENAAALGVYVHGRAGDIAAAKKGKAGLIASDIAENLPYAIKELSGE